MSTANVLVIPDSLPPGNLDSRAESSINGSERLSISYKSYNDDKVAFKNDTTGMMVPISYKDNISLTSAFSLDSQVTRRLRRHTAVQTSCQHCGENVMTRVYHRKTFFTYLCTLLLLPCCMCWIPHVVQKFQRPVHVCPICSQTVTEQTVAANKVVSSADGKTVN